MDICKGSAHSFCRSLILQTMLGASIQPVPQMPTPAVFALALPKEQDLRHRESIEYLLLRRNAPLAWLQYLPGDSNNGNRSQDKCREYTRDISCTGPTENVCGFLPFCHHLPSSRRICSGGGCVAFGLVGRNRRCCNGRLSDRRCYFTKLQHCCRYNIVV